MRQDVKRSTDLVTPTSAGRRERASPITRGSPIRQGPLCTRTAASRGTSRRGRGPARRKKKPPGRELTPAEKRTNRTLGRMRVRVEHALAGVKRCRAVKDVLRNTAEGVSDAVMETACGLHNLRVAKRGQRRNT